MRIVATDDRRRRSAAYHSYGEWRSLRTRPRHSPEGLRIAGRRLACRQFGVSSSRRTDVENRAAWHLVLWRAPADCGGEREGAGRGAGHVGDLLDVGAVRLVGPLRLAALNEVADADVERRGKPAIRRWVYPVRVHSNCVNGVDHRLCEAGRSICVADANMNYVRTVLLATGTGLVTLACAFALLPSPLPSSSPARVTKHSTPSVFFSARRPRITEPGAEVLAKLRPPRSSHRAQGEWGGMMVDDSVAPRCDTNARCGLARACVDGYCVGCRMDTECDLGEQCVLEHCILSRKTLCHSRSECPPGDVCLLTAYSPTARGNEDIIAACTTQMQQFLEEQ